jgi:hypothetical protein
MNLELILWIASGIIIWEIIYILFIKYLDYDEEYWLEAKLYSLFVIVFFMGIQVTLVFANENNTAHYINLLWEFLIIIGLTLFFLLNKWIAKKITK